jgi:acyl-CoA thioester hydrolase
VDAPVLFFAPFVSSVLRVERLGTADIGSAHCHRLVDRALAELLELIGCDADYRAARDAGVVLIESHFNYQRKVTETLQFRLTAQLIDCDDHRIYLYVELRHAADGWLAANGECVLRHVDRRSDAAIPFPDAMARNLIVMRAAHARLPRPADLGRAISLFAQPARLN